MRGMFVKFSNHLEVFSQHSTLPSWQHLPFFNFSQIYVYHILHLIIHYFASVHCQFMSIELSVHSTASLALSIFLRLLKFLIIFQNVLWFLVFFWGFFFNRCAAALLHFLAGLTFVNFKAVFNTKRA